LKNFFLSNEEVYIIAIWNPSFKKDINIQCTISIQTSSSREDYLALLAVGILLLGIAVGAGIFFYCKWRAGKTKGLVYIPLSGVNTVQ
jgi:hypothetical protein